MGLSLLDPDYGSRSSIRGLKQQQGSIQSETEPDVAMAQKEEEVSIFELLGFPQLDHEYYRRNLNKEGNRRHGFIGGVGDSPGKIPHKL